MDVGPYFLLIVVYNCSTHLLAILSVIKSYTSDVYNRRDYKIAATRNDATSITRDGEGENEGKRDGEGKRDSEVERDGVKVRDM